MIESSTFSLSVEAKYQRLLTGHILIRKYTQTVSEFPTMTSAGADTMKKTVKHQAFILPSE